MAHDFDLVRQELRNCNRGLGVSEVDKGHITWLIYNEVLPLSEAKVVRNCSPFVADTHASESCDLCCIVEGLALDN